MSMKSFFVPALAFLLVGCPGGWRDKMISTYSLHPVPSGTVLFATGGYPAELVSQPYLIDGVLYLRMFAKNPHDLAFDDPVDAKFHISGLMSAAVEDISIDVASFHIERVGEQDVLLERVVVTYARPAVKHYGEQPKTTCGYWESEIILESGYLEIPRYAREDAWPPYNIDDSILCFYVDFPLSILDIPPSSYFQLKFDYAHQGKKKEVTIYFYPLKYEDFEN